MTERTYALRDGLGLLADAVTAYFANHGVTANTVIGWKESAKQTNQGPGGANRVCFTPSDESGNGGTFTQPKVVGQYEIKDPTGTVVAYATPIADWQRLVMVSVWAQDPTKPEDERAQYEATVDLYERTRRAIRRFAPHPNTQFGGAKWMRPALERAFGRELVVAMTFTFPIFDEVVELAFPTAAAVTKNPDLK